MARVGNGIGLDLSPVINALFQGTECDVSMYKYDSHCDGTRAFVWSMKEARLGDMQLLSVK